MRTWHKGTRQHKALLIFLPLHLIIPEPPPVLIWSSEWKWANDQKNWFQHIPPSLLLLKPGFQWLRKPCDGLASHAANGQWGEWEWGGRSFHNEGSVGSAPPCSFLLPQTPRCCLPWVWRDQTWVRQRQNVDTQHLLSQAHSPASTAQRKAIPFAPRSTRQQSVVPGQPGGCSSDRDSMDSPEHSGCCNTFPAHAQESSISSWLTQG